MFKIISIVCGGGYKYARTLPLHPRANPRGYYPLHRVLVENSLGRLLDKTEVVHHKDGNKNNNDSSNLVVLTQSEHAKEHNKTKEPIKSSCGNCGKQILLRPHIYRQRIGRNKTGKVFCSISCSVILQHKK